jgi:hypothetical protein
MKFFFGVVLGLSLTGCPPTPISPRNDASDSAPPTFDDASSFEQNVCNQLAAAGCKSAASTNCAAGISENKIPGGFATAWSACVYSGANPLSCHVPCSQ